MKTSESGVMLITGTRKGLGRSLAEHYIDRGWMVIGCSRAGSDLQHERYRHFEVDVADEPGVKGLFSAVRSEYGHLDALVNNAGIASMNHMLLTPTRAIRNIMETNVIGTMLFAREAAKLMQRRRTGRIINFVTVATPLKLEGEAAYAASKAAVVNFTQVAARELAEFGITVNAVGPTPVRTDLIKSVPEAKLEALLQRQAIHRFGEFRDVANVVDFFLAPASDFVTGQVIYLGGV